jgi:plasmid maintenance system antidote protein VapI
MVDNITINRRRYKMNKKLKGRIVELFGSQANFAQMIQAEEATVSRIVHGRRRLNEEDLHWWSRVLDCDPSVIQSGQNDRGER